MNKIDVFLEATLVEMVASIMISKGIITFGSKDLPLGGVAHNNALYLTVICLQKYMSIALVDNDQL